QPRLAMTSSHCLTPGSYWTFRPPQQRSSMDATGWYAIGGAFFSSQARVSRRNTSRSAMVVSSAVELAHDVQHLLGVLLGAGDARPVLLHLAVLADQHGRADHADGLLAVE